MALSDLPLQPKDLSTDLTCMVLLQPVRSVYLLGIDFHFPIIVLIFMTVYLIVYSFPFF